MKLIVNNTDPNVVDLKQHKKTKQWKLLLEEMDSILKLFTLAQEGLKHFRHHILAQETISMLQTNKSLLEMKRKKYVDQMEADAKEHSQ